VRRGRGGKIRTPFEDFRGHVAGGTTDLGEHGQFVFVHNATQTEIGDHNVCILLLGSKQQVLGLQIAMNDTGGVDVLDSAHDSADKVGGVGLIVVSFGTDAVEELATSTKVEDEVEVMRGFKIVVQRYDVTMATGDVFEDGNFIANLEVL